jgi:type III secretion protein J
VASSVPGLTVDKVSVVLVAASAPPPSTAGRNSAASQLLVLAYVLGALAVLCIAGYAGWRFYLKQRGPRADADGDMQEASA